jgi:polysaccharide biosynthesis protein PslA
VNFFAARMASESAAVPAASAGAVAWKGDFGRLRLRLYAILLLSDALFMAASFLLANELRFGSFATGFGLNTFALLFPVYVAVGYNGQAWSIAALSSPRRSAALAAKALLISIAVATALLFSLKIGDEFSRVVFGIGAALSLVAIATARIALGHRFGDRYRWTFRKEALLVDDVPLPALGTHMLIDAGKLELTPATDDPIMLDRLARLLDSCERVVIACPPERRMSWARMLAGANVDAELLMPEFDSLGAIGMRRHEGHSTVLVGCGPLRLRDRFVKRAFDVAFSACALIALAPVFALIALAIRLESPGPVLFRQDRLGRGNRLFSILKFRSMRSDKLDLAGSRSASRDDDRVTRIGRFLRGTSLDELPQLINVLKGEMSIVGPRPHPLGCRAEDQLFWAIDERYFDRHAIKPGMTGLAQVRGYRGATEKLSDVTDRLRADLEYLSGWHIGRDIAITLRTLGVLVHAKAF